MEIVKAEPFEVEASPGEAPGGKPCLTVVVKATFELRDDGKHEPSKDPIPVFFADQLYEALDYPSAVLEGDMVPFKPRADIVLLGKAYAPAGSTTTALDTTVRVGNVRKTIRVIGDREYQFVGGEPVATHPKAFETIDLVYERAFGGMDQLGGAVFAKNRLGRGFFVKPAKESMEMAPLPSLEDPARMITSWRQQPDPVGFGFYPRNHQPRFAYLGTIDDDWSKNRAPLFPLDFKYEYYNGAHPDLQVEGYLKGTEDVELTNLTPEGRVRFKLPGVSPQIQVWRYDPFLRALFEERAEDAELPDLDAAPRRAEVLDAKLDTLVLLPEEKRFYLVWRGRTPIESADTISGEIAKVEVTLREGKSSAPQRG